MAINLERRTLLKSTLAAGALALGPRYAFGAKTLKVGFVYPSPIGDFGWSYRHEIGRQQVVEEFGDAVETTFIQNVAEGPDAERTIERLARSGHDLIFTGSFGYMNPTISVARKFPDVKFENNTGYKTAENVSAYNARFHEGRSVFGTIAGHMTESGVVGYIGSFPIPEVIMGINAFTLSAQKIRPDIQVKVVWVNKWFDPGLEADAAKALIDGGADIITQHTNSTSPCQVAEERGAYCFGQDSDMSQFAPERHLTGIVNNWGPYYVRRVRDVIENRWTSQSSWDGLAEGVVQLAPLNSNLPDDVRAAAEATKAAIIDGSLHPFEGPITSREGVEILPAGQTLSDEEIHKMNYFVKGITGELPS
ncbi:BMP family ABC transporter substrate-binding protein [Nitratireductor sp. XY-223]|uniref:BMP family ABC transporter substrate-binding protein n=1 Tax=Nitratireductor sp. XY-223 TaxID=2561926 RepID=UPI00145A2A1F|nr:BMP family ABC transporter substrate-binding protein [Nitratireductor sp. XY-223]